jgi:cyclic pyranopterin phosphate synthase
MVDVSNKSKTARRAVAESSVSMSKAAFEALSEQRAAKGDVLATARIAGIMAAKRTSDIIPLCHPLGLTHCEVSLELVPGEQRVVVQATTEVFAQTGVEMEAMLAATAAALTVYDMLKGIDRGMTVGPTKLLAKSGGKSGDYKR